MADKIVADRVEVGDDTSTAMAMTEIMVEDCQRCGVGNLFGVSCFRSPRGYRGKAGHGSVSSEAGGTLKWREKLRALVEPSDSRASLA